MASLPAGALGAFSVGVSLGSALTYYVLTRRTPRVRPDAKRLRRLRSREAPVGSESGVYFNSADAPGWLRGLFSDASQRRLLLREWEDAEWRMQAGWKGTDLIHDPAGTGVQARACARDTHHRAERRRHAPRSNPCEWC